MVIIPIKLKLLSTTPFSAPTQLTKLQIKLNNGS